MSSSSAVSTSNAIRIHENGDSSKLVWDTNFPFPAPTADEVTVELAYAGVNYIDTYHRTGLYPVQFPFRIGREGAGKVIALGENVKKFKVGDRVAFALGGGSYATHVNVATSALFSVPSSISLKTAAAALLQGFTAHYLVASTYQVTKDTTVLIHAAAGGTGQLVVQLSKARGATVIATVGSPEKVEIARSLGADHIINYNENKKWDDEVKKLTNGHGVHVVYDGVGATTYMQSLLSLRKRGYLVLFGNASGPVPPFDPLLLSKHGSLFVTRPTLADYIVTEEERQWRANEIFQSIEKGQLKIEIGQEFDVKDAKAAHEALESRKVAGKTVLRINDSIQ